MFRVPCDMPALFSCIILLVCYITTRHCLCLYWRRIIWVLSLIVKRKTKHYGCREKGGGAGRQTNRQQNGEWDRRTDRETGQKQTDRLTKRQIHRRAKSDVHICINTDGQKLKLKAGIQETVASLISLTGPLFMLSLAGERGESRRGEWAAPCQCESRGFGKLHVFPCQRQALLCHPTRDYRWDAGP